jgi:1-deoxy-D-xylulose-5-phosphate synthase
LKIGTGEELTVGKKVCILALGNMVELAEEVANKLRIHGLQPGIASAIFAKPVDGNLLTQLAKKYEIIATVEDNVLAGGFGSAILEACENLGIAPKIIRFGWADKFIAHASSTDILRKENGLSPDSIAKKIISMV